MAFRYVRKHRKTKSTDLTTLKLLDVPGQKGMAMPVPSKSTGALCTPPRSKAKKDKKKAKKSKESDLSQLELSLEWKKIGDVKNQKRSHSITPLSTSPADSPAFKKKPLRGTVSSDSYMLRKVKKQERSPLHSSDSEYDEHTGSKLVADGWLKDEPDGPVPGNDTRRKSFFHELQRSHSLDMLSDEHKFNLDEAQHGAQDLEDLLQSRNVAYQRFISTQDHVMVSERRKQDASKSKSFQGPKDRHRVVQQEESPVLLRRGDVQVAQSMSHRVVQQSRNSEDLMHLIEANIDVNILDEVTGDALIHIIMKKKRKQERLDFLLTLLIHARVNVNLRNKKGVAALHLAVEEGDEMCVKVLVVFGADVNMEGRNYFTPMDLAINNGTVPEIEDLFIKLQAKSSAQLIERVDSQVLSNHLCTKKKRLPRRILSKRSMTQDRIADFINRKNMLKLCRELESNINQRLSFSASLGGDDDNTVLVMQQREVALFNKTLRKSAHYSAVYELEEGSRVLCLDGGGIKGLIEIEVLMQIEAKMKRKITELFDWIIGTSTGGIIALGLVYGGKSLSDLRQLYFRIKDEIFAKGRYGFAWDSDAYEEILQQYLDPKIMMMDVTHPKVLVAAVNKATTNLELNFFNNCLGDEYCDYPVWKVARYTSAAPMFLRECDNYVDGGMICNNPTDCGLTVIQNYYRKQEVKPPISLVVSVGSGLFPAEKIGKVDAQAFLYFGKQWLHISKLMKRTQNLLTLFSQALVESEKVTENSRSRCQEQNIPFYRFNPKLNDIIPAGETDNTKLLDMVIETKIQIKEQKLKEMAELLQVLTVSSQDVSEVLQRSPSPCTPAEKDAQPPSSEKKKSDLAEKRREFQVPQLSITAADDKQEQLYGDEDSTSPLTDQYNDMLNESIVHPTTEPDMDNHRTTSSARAAEDFSTELDEQNKLSNGQLPLNHYQLKVDNQVQTDQTDELLETS